jgi:hypothetical protein
LLALVEGLNRLEATERTGGSDDLWRGVRSIIGGLVPAVHWPDSKPPNPTPHTILGNPPTTPDPQWTASMFNRLVRGSGIKLAAEVVDGAVVPFVHLPDLTAGAAWALWWAFREGELGRLRRCTACGRWFRDATKPKNQTHCSKRCTRRLNMRAYRAGLRQKRRGRKSTKRRRA